MRSGAKQAVIAGHDWGAPVAWHAALLRPDRFRGVIGLSVPFRPRGPVRPTTVMPQTEDAIFYQLYFQDARGRRGGVRARRAPVYPRRALTANSGRCAAPVPRTRSAWCRAGRFRRPHGNSRRRRTLPRWLTEADIDFYAAEFARTGFRGGLNCYRNIDRNWELLAPFAGAKVTVPALYIAGDRDLVMAFRGMDQLIANLRAFRCRSCAGTDNPARLRPLDPAGAGRRRSTPR